MRGSISKNLYEQTEFESTVRTYALPTTTDAASNTTPTQQINVQTESTKTSRTWDTDTTFAFGMGYNRDNFTIDLTLLKEFVTQGVDSPLTSRVNATWKF